MNKIIVGAVVGAAALTSIGAPAIAQAAPASTSTVQSASVFADAASVALPTGTTVADPATYADGIIEYHGAVTSDDYGVGVDLSWNFALTEEQLAEHTWTYVMPVPRHTRVDLSNPSNLAHEYHAKMTSGSDEHLVLTVLRDGVVFQTATIPVPVIPNDWDM